MSIAVKNERIEWIDFCKFIAIFYMVWGHSGMPNSLDKYIHVFHMPIFFFLSGYVLKINKIANFKDLIVKKAKSLLVPYFVFAISIYYFWSIVYKIANKPIPEPQINLVKGIFTINTVIEPFAAVQWFLTCLFLVEIIFYIIIKVSKQNMIVLSFILFMFSLLGYIYGYITCNRLYWGLDTAFTAVVFYGLGYLFNNLKNNRLKKILYSPKLFNILILFSVSIIATYFNGYVNMRIIQYGNYFLFYISSISSILMYLIISNCLCRIRQFRNSRLFKYLLLIGQNTIVVLVLNQLFIQIISKFINHLTVINKNIWGVVCTILVIILMIPTSNLINKYLPFVIGKRKKFIS